MILHGELEIGERDGDEATNDQQYDEDDDQDRVDGVHLVPPDAREDVVQLCADTREDGRVRGCTAATQGNAPM